MSIRSKTCKKCGETKPLVDFYGKTRQAQFPESSAGFSSDCKVCVRERTAAYRKARRQLHVDYMKEIDLKRKYGINLEQYNRMFASQGGCCAICGKHQVEFVKGLAVDHDHVTGQVRSLLCVNCNLGVGCFRENIQLLRVAIQYLERFQTNNTHPAQEATGSCDNSGQIDQESIH